MEGRADGIVWLRTGMRRMPRCAVRLGGAGSGGRHCTGVVLNIAEGNGKFSLADRKRFLNIALISGLQTASRLDTLKARLTTTPEVTRQGKEHLVEIVAMIGALARSPR